MAVVSELLRPKMKPQNAKPSSLDDFDFPTAEEGRSIPVIAGKVKVNGPNVTWYGNLSVSPIKKKVKTGWFSSATQILGYKYRLSMQMALCHGSDEGVEVHDILFGDAVPKHTRGTTVDGLTTFEFDDNDFYGGNEKEGGVAGTLRFYHGTYTQPSNGHMTTMLGEEFPAYHGLCHSILEGFYLGTSAYIKPIGYVLSRYMNQLGVPDDHHIIGEDCNPACFLYELMTNKIWGVGMMPADIDTAAFTQVAETLYEEGLGMSMIYNGSALAKDVVAEILRHVDGVMFSDPATGLITIALARKDYVIADLPVLGKSEFKEGIKFSRPSWSETINTVKASYVDRAANYTVAVESQQDLANIQQRGGQISQQEYDYTGFTTHAPARAAVARTLKTVSYPLAKMAGDLDRRFWKLRPAGVFVLHWPERGINNVVMRIVSVSYSNLSRNLVGIEAVEDIFNVTHIAYIDPGPSGWENPVGFPTPLDRQALVEAPAFNAPTDAKFVITLAGKTPKADVGYDVLIDGEFSNSVPTFTPVGLLYTAVFADTPYEMVDYIEVDSLIGADLIDDGTEEGASQASGHNLLIIGNEWFAWKSRTYDVGTGRYRFHGAWRGVLDTVPEDHTVGSVVWFVSEGAGLAGEDGFAADVSLDVKLLPRTVRGALISAAATEMSITTDSRAARPLPPGNPKLDGVRFVDATAETGAFTVTWASRNRFWPQVIKQDNADIDPEGDAFYTLRIYNADTDALIVQAEEFDAKAATVNLTTSGNIRIELLATRSGLDSWSTQTAVIAYTAAGAPENIITPDTAAYILDGGGA